MNSDVLRGNHSSAGDDVELAVSMPSPCDNVTATCNNLSAGGVADEVDECMWFRFVVNTLLIGLLCLFGLFGNTLSLFVLERDRRNRVAVFLLQARLSFF